MQPQEKRESACGGGPGFLVFSERLTDEVANTGGNLISLFCEGYWVGFTMLDEQFWHSPSEWGGSGQHLIGNHTQAVNVRGLIDSFSTALLRGHIFRRPHHRTEAA